MVDTTTADKPIPCTTNALPSLYSTRQVYIAALLGGAIGGGWLLSLNFKAVDERSQHKIAMFACLLLTVLSAIGAMWLPTDFSPNYLIPFIVAGIFATWNHIKLEAVFTSHKENGGAQASWWKTIGISLATLPVTIILFIFVYLSVPILPVNHVKDGISIIYYEGDATREDAESLAKFFRETGVFSEDMAVDMTLVFPKNDTHLVVIEIPFLKDIKRTPTHDAIKALANLLDEKKYISKDVEIYVQNAFGLTKFVVRNE